MGDDNLEVREIERDPLEQHRLRVLQGRVARVGGALVNQDRNLQLLRRAVDPVDPGIVRVDVLVDGTSFRPHKPSSDTARASSSTARRRSGPRTRSRSASAGGP